MIKILFSNKDDWKTKSEGGYNKELYEFNYVDFSALKKINAYDMVIPLYEKDIHVLNNQYKKWEHKFIIPSNEVVDFCNDKLRFNLYLTEKGFGAYIPNMYTSSAPFPYILKKNFDEWGLNAHIIDGPEKEKSLAPFLDDPEYFKQQYIVGTEEFATHFIYSENKLIYCQTFKFTFPKPFFVKGAESPPFKTAVIILVKTDYTPLFEDILKLIGFNGVGCFNFKLENGVPKIFELNPRVGGSLPLDLIPFLQAYQKGCESKRSFKPKETRGWAFIKKLAGF